MLRQPARRSRLITALRSAAKRLWRLPGVHLAGIFAQRHIPHIMPPVFDLQCPRHSAANSSGVAAHAGRLVSA